MPDEVELYSRIVAFVSKTTGIRAERIHATTRLQRDCGVTGDDAVELMLKFSERFSVDLLNLSSTGILGLNHPAICSP